MKKEAKYVTVKSAAAELGGLSERTVRNMIWRGELAAYRFGRRVLIKQAELEQFVRSQPMPKANRER